MTAHIGRPPADTLKAAERLLADGTLRSLSIGAITDEVFSLRASLLADGGLMATRDGDDPADAVWAALRDLREKANARLPHLRAELKAVEAVNEALAKHGVPLPSDDEPPF